MTHHGPVKCTHPCTREGPRPIVNFIMNEHGGPVLTYTIDLNSHGEVCLNSCFYKRKKSSVKRPREAVTPAEVPAWLRVGPGRFWDAPASPLSAKLTPASQVQPFCELVSHPPPSFISQKGKYFMANKALFFNFPYKF